MANPWLIHVKKWSIKNKKSFACAITDPQCQNEYKGNKNTRKNNKSSSSKYKQLSYTPLPKPEFLPPPAKTDNNIIIIYQILNSKNYYDLFNITISKKIDIVSLKKKHSEMLYRLDVIRKTTLFKKSIKLKDFNNAYKKLNLAYKTLTNNNLRNTYNTYTFN